MAIPPIHGECQPSYLAIYLHYLPSNQRAARKGAHVSETIADFFVTVQVPVPATRLSEFYVRFGRWLATPPGAAAFGELPAASLPKTPSARRLPWSGDEGELTDAT